MSAVNAGPSQDIFSFSFGGSGDNLLAAGSKSQVCNLLPQALFPFSFTELRAYVKYRCK